METLLFLLLLPVALVLGMVGCYLVLLVFYGPWWLLCELGWALREWHGSRGPRRS